MAGHDVGVGACGDIGECGAAVDSYQRVRLILVSALEGPAAIRGAAVECVLALAEGGHGGADFVELLDVVGEVAFECGGNLAVSGVLGEVGGLHVAFEVVPEVGAAGVDEGGVHAVINQLACLEFNLRAVIEAGDAAEGEHPGEVLGPLCCAAVESDAVVGSGTVVVGVDIDHVE